MGKFKQSLCNFILGFFDSISLYWVRKILLVTEPQTKNINPSSFLLLSTLKNTFIQVFFFMVGLPSLFHYFNQHLIATIMSTIFLLLTYGYLLFYNTEVITLTKKVALWSTKFHNTYFCQFDIKQKIQIFYNVSIQFKSFVFLLFFYVPIFSFCLILTNYLPTIGTIVLIISESFFNATFYFLKKWPCDRYNVGFLEKNMAYMLGYGFFVSLVCNLFLSGDLSRGAYFMISQWMTINCLLFSPTEKQFESVAEVWKCVTSAEARSKLPNGYNIHRNKMRKDKAYRDELIKQMFMLKPALKITQMINSLLQRKLDVGKALRGSNEGYSKSQPVSVQSNQSKTSSLETVTQSYENQQ